MTKKHYVWSNLFVGSHTPLRFQLGCHVVLGKDGFLGDTTGTISSVADSTELDLGDSALVAANTTSIAHSVRVSNPLWRCKV